MNRVLITGAAGTIGSTLRRTLRGVYPVLRLSDIAALDPAGPRDFTQLVRIGLEKPDLHCEIVYGVSNNDRGWWDNTVAEAMGYRPRDNSEDYAAAVLEEEAKRPVDDIAERFQGGTFASDEFAGDLSRW